MFTENAPHGIVRASCSPHSTHAFVYIPENEVAASSSSLALIQSLGRQDGECPDCGCELASSFTKRYGAGRVDEGSPLYSWRRLVHSGRSWSMSIADAFFLQILCPGQSQPHRPSAISLDRVLRLRRHRLPRNRFPRIQTITRHLPRNPLRILPRRPLLSHRTT